MRLSILLATLTSLPLIFASPNPGSRSRSQKPYCPARHANEEYQRDIFNNFVTTLYGDKNAILAFDTYVDVNLIEHDPFDGQGRAANEAKLNGIIPYANFQVLRQSFDNNIGFIHLKVNEADPVALADIYRMDGTCIVEHWDIAQPKPLNATNPIAMF